MTRGVRWLIGAAIALMLLGAALFIGFFGGIWALVGGVADVAMPQQVSGQVVAVDPVTDELTVRFTPPPPRSGAPGSGTEGAETPTSETGPVEGTATWSSSTALPEVGDEVVVSTSSTDPTRIVSVRAGSGSDPRFFLEAGKMLLVAAGVLLLLSVLTLVATGVWAARAPRSHASPPTATLPPQDDWRWRTGPGPPVGPAAGPAPGTPRPPPPGRLPG